MLYISGFTAAEVFFYPIGITCWNQLDVLPTHSSATVVLYFAQSILPSDVFTVYTKAEMILRPRFSRLLRTLWPSNYGTQNKTTTVVLHSKNKLLVRSVLLLLLVVTVLPVAGLQSTNSYMEKDFSN
jgi:hypothetical protein